jgi:large subunit ribosomal protein L25
MAESVELLAEIREGTGSRVARKLREKHKVPAVIYGHKEKTVPLELNGDELAHAIRHGIRVVDLKTNGEVQKALIREVQWDHLGKELLHVDFLRVAKDERIHVNVRVEVRGIAPGVTAGGVLDQPIHTVAVECLAINVPESIRVNINELQIDGAIHVRELVVPPDVKVLGDPDAIVVQISAPQAEAAPAAEAAEALAEPERIGRQRAEEETEEKK